MKNEDLFRLHAGLQGVADLRGAKFAYACAKNLRKVGALCDDLKAGVKPSAAYQVYDKARIALAREHAEKDENGQPAINGQGYKVPDMIAFEKVLEPLKAEHAEAVAEHEAKVADFQALLEEEAEITLYTIPFDLVPEDISVGQYDMILEIVDDPEDA